MENNTKMPDGSFFRLNCMYAFISESNDGEGLVAIPTPGGMMPLVGGDMDRVKSLKKIADGLGIKYKIYIFTKRELMEFIEA